MSKLDRLGWAAGIAFETYGVRLGVRASQAGVVDQLPAYLPPGCRPLATPLVDRLYSLIVGGPGPRPGMRRLHVLYGDTALLARAPVL